MSTVFRDSWPSDTGLVEVARPVEILTFQAGKLEERTKGLLHATVRESAVDERTDLTFEVSAPLIDTTVVLFRKRRRTGDDYPAVLVPPEPFPAFLKPTVRSVQRPKGPFGLPLALDSVEVVDEPNPWVAATDCEFADRVEEMLRLPEVRSLLTNLMARISTAMRSSDAGESTSNDANGDSHS